MDDANWHAASTAGSAEIIAHGINALILVHHGTFGHQCSHFGLLPVGNWRLGLVESQMGHRYGKFSYIAGCHRFFLHIANLFAHSRGQYDRSFEI